MSELAKLLDNNREWAQKALNDDPGFFQLLSQQQSPRYPWIGCSDSRVPANQILGLDPGEVPVNRNIAKVMAHGDLNCLSVIHYAVESPEGPLHPAGRPLRLWRRACGHDRRSRGPGRQLAATCRRRGAKACRLAGSGRIRVSAWRAPMRAQRDRTGGERLPDHRGPGRLGQRPQPCGAWLDVRPVRRPAAAVGHGRGIERAADAGLSARNRHGLGEEFAP